MTLKETRINLAYLPHQKEVFGTNHKFIVYAKGRRAGGTEGAARFCLRKIIKQPTKILWVDVVHRNISRYIDRYFLPRLKPLSKNYWNWNGLKMTLSVNIHGDNNSYIDFGSAERPENMEGQGYDLIVINEAGIILWNEGIYHNTLLPMSIEGEGARWFFIGAPKGDNLFKKLYDRGLDPNEPDWLSIRHTSYDNPIVNNEYVDQQKDLLPEALFRQNYLAVFLSDAGFFGNLDGLQSIPEERDPVPASEYVIGVDLAKEVDFTVLWVGRVDTREGVYCERFNKIPWPEQVERIKQVAQHYSDAAVYPDATGLGSVIVDDLIDQGVRVGEGFILTNQSKHDLLTTLASDIEHKRLATCEHAQTLTEVKAFQRIPLKSGRDRLEAPPGMNDDCVIALALMNYALGRPHRDTSNEIFTTPSLVNDDNLCL